MFCDLSLARRLEKTEGQSCVSYAEARARIAPEVGACWIEVAGAKAVFAGVSSPVTQTFGLGLFDEVRASHFDTIEEFFISRHAPVFHEVSPLADAALLPLLTGRGYSPIELTSVMFRPLDADAGISRAPSNIVVRAAGGNDHELWAKTAAEGWSDLVDPAFFTAEVSRVAAEREAMTSFLVEIDGATVAAGALSICEGVALLAGASTIPAARRRGAQNALLDARLAYARQRGCDLAMMCALPGSASQRNAERHGFRIAYTRIKWQLTR